MPELTKIRNLGPSCCGRLLGTLC